MNREQQLSWNLTGQTQKPGSAKFGTLDGLPIIARIPSREVAVVFFRAREFRGPAGSADEQVIDSMQKQRECGAITSEMTGMVAASQRRRFAIQVTDAEALDASRDYWRSHDAGDLATTYRRRNITVMNGLKRVYEEGADLNVIYKDPVASAGITPAAWQAYLEWGRTPERRDQLERFNGLNGDALKAETANIRAFRPFLERKKLDAAIDLELAAGDPVFKMKLDEQHRATNQISQF